MAIVEQEADGHKALREDVVDHRLCSNLRKPPSFKAVDFGGEASEVVLEADQLLFDVQAGREVGPEANSA